MMAMLDPRFYLLDNLVVRQNIYNIIGTNVCFYSGAICLVSMHLPLYPNPNFH